MAIKTFINGQENGIITFKGDTEPCSVFVNGEKQDNISYIPEPISGVNSVEYSSEYKKNIRTMQIDGNTEQEQGEKTFNESASIPASFVGNGNAQTNNIVSATPINLPFEGEWELIFNYDGSAGASFEVDIAYSQEDLFSYSGTRKLLYPFAEKVTVNQPFYIGVSDPTQQYLATELQQTFWNALISSGLTLAGTFQTPSPELPSPIQNAGDNGIECVLRGKNLCDLTYLTENAYIASGGYYSVKIYVGKGNRVTAFINEKLPLGLSFYLGIAYGEGLTLPNSPKSIWLYHSTISDLCFRKRSFVSQEDYIYVSYNDKKDMLANVKYLQVEIGEETPYEPYFHKTLSLPSSVTVDGQEVELRTGGLSTSTTNYRSHILVDRIKNKVFYYEYQKLATTNRAYSRLRILQDVVWFHAGYLGATNWQARPSLCTHFQRKYSTTYNVVGFAQGGLDSIIYISLPLTMFADPTNPTVAEANTWLQNEADKGTPVAFLTTYAEPLEYDLTETELGQQILDFVNSTQNATNIIEIQSMPSVSQLSVNYAKWGGTPNANNT